jgi:hypothetical protein
MGVLSGETAVVAAYMLVSFLSLKDYSYEENSLVFGTALQHTDSQ